MTLFQKEKTEVKSFNNSEDFMDHLYDVSLNSQWKILNSDNVYFWINDAKDRNGVDLCLEDRGNGETRIREAVAFPSICARAQVFGESLQKLKKDVLASFLSKCLETRGPILMKALVQYNKISAIHSAEYTPLKMDDIFYEAEEEFDKLKKGESFKSAEWDFKYCTAEYEVDNDEITEAYNDALVRNNIISSPKKVKLLIRVTTSDVATSGINLTYKVRIYSGTCAVDIPLNQKREISIKHTGDAQKKMEEYKQKLADTLAIYKANQEQLFKLMSIKIYNSENCLKGMLKKSNIPLKYANKIVNRFTCINGNNPCSAYEIYAAMCYLLELVSEEENSSSTNTLRYEELLAKSVTKNFKDFDVTGEIAW